MFGNRMRYIAKRFVNPIMRRSAGSARSPFALLRHVGRRSGKTYETPLIVIPMCEDFLIALTYGPGVDWYRNLQAAGQGTLLWHGQIYRISILGAVDRAEAISAFATWQQSFLRLMDVRHFVRVKATRSEAVTA